MSVLYKIAISSVLQLPIFKNFEGQMKLSGSLAIGGVVGGLGRIGMNGEMCELASQANELYAGYLESLFAEHGLLIGSPKIICPVIKGSDGEKTVGNVLELVKIAPKESRRKSLLSSILGVLSLFLFITSIPGIIAGAAAIITGNSVLKRQGYQPMAYTGRFLGKIGVGMSSVVTIIYIAIYFMSFFNK